MEQRARPRPEEHDPAGIGFRHVFLRAPFARPARNDQPQLSAQDLLDQLRGHFEKLCIDVAAAVNQAPADAQNPQIRRPERPPADDRS
jgi:hypothetical protein